MTEAMWVSDETFVQWAAEMHYVILLPCGPVALMPSAVLKHMHEAYNEGFNSGWFQRDEAFDLSSGVVI